ncbi:MAG: DUF1961 family protein [Planctomycetota bacterium]|jgi:hypothetical protein
MRVLLLLAGFTLATGAAARAGAARNLPKGLGGDPAREGELRAVSGKLLKLVTAGQPDYRAVFETAQAARGIMARIAAGDGEPDTPELPGKTPLVSYGEVGTAGVLARWREQLDYYARSAVGLLDGDVKYVEEWCGRPGYRKPERRVKGMTALLREASRTAILLSRPQEEVRARKGQELFADDFSGGSAKWTEYGDCKTANDGDAFRMQDTSARSHPDAMIWTKREFEGDFLVEFTFVPHTEGTRAGALFSICGRPRGKNTLAICVGRSMDTYNHGIDAYHFSMHRGTTGLGNARRVGPGLKLLMSGKDPCPTPGQAYRVSIGRFGPAIFLLIDGKLVHHYFDAATYGPVLTGGHIGIRHWAGLEASYRDFRVFRLEAAKRTPDGRADPREENRR